MSRLCEKCSVWTEAKRNDRAAENEKWLECHKSTVTETIVDLLKRAYNAILKREIVSDYSRCYQKKSNFQRRKRARIFEQQRKKALLKAEGGQFGDENVQEKRSMAGPEDVVCRGESGSLVSLLSRHGLLLIHRIVLMSPIPRAAYVTKENQTL
ncbi:hypothetical protein LOD99_2266 [Oopsacas minuta]|uniref:Uncharacterized protein n=1 Tax=Oopsacas minuta TaxID=111878 RepID=A0AAV7K2R4_9METZ|nr:hypothetical protein LOD99_2266 [Oopsacas minuta]